VDKITENKSYCEEKNKENKENMLNFVNTNKITKKDQLPNIRRSSSLNSKNEQKIRLIEEKMILICDERPPLPKKPLRA
jgi:hypothetical protein